jgi:hypothetical protein
MANWRYKIQLNKVLADLDKDYDFSRLEEDCPPEAKEKIAQEIEKALPLNHLAGRVRNAKSIAALNRALEAVYNEADRTLVWCGF